MKPRYSKRLDKWTANGIGVFDSEEEARNAIEKNKVKALVSVMMTEREAEEIKRLAESRGVGISKVARELIRKGMQNG